MSAMNPNNRFPSPLTSDQIANLPVVASQQVNAGQLCYWDTGASPKVLKPMSLYTGSGTAATDRRAIAKIFAGAFLQGMIAAQATNGYPAYPTPGVDIGHGCIYEADCASATFDAGTLVGVVSAGAGAVGDIDNYKVVAVTAADEAIGRVVCRYPSAVTKVRIKLFGLLNSEDSFKLTVVGAQTLPAGGSVTAADIRTALIAQGLAR